MIKFIYLTTLLADPSTTVLPYKLNHTVEQAELQLTVQLARLIGRFHMTHFKRHGGHISVPKQCKRARPNR